MPEASDFNPVINKAYLVGVETPQQSFEDAQVLLEELEELVSNLDIGIIHSRVVKIRERNARFLLGVGKTEEIVAEIKALGCDSVIFDEELSPAQQRNWDKACGGSILVLDRQEVILDIFNKRAQTKEAVLQVQLARLEYELPRMKRAWTHLDRQKGGGAMQRDAGEKQIEIDQRLIRKRIARLKQELKEVVQHRQVQRKQRMKVPIPSAAIVGYTNAGKSSLLNRLTGAEVLAEDKLFATLDPTTRRATLPSGQVLLLTDTVGFVRRLPHRLVEAFKATLEEAVVSSFLIHVVDASSPDAEKHFKTTMDVLKELGAERKRIITVFNKLDRLETDDEAAMRQAELRALDAEGIFISAYTGDRVVHLLDRCESMLEDIARPMSLIIPHDRYDLIHTLHQAGAVTAEKHEADGVHIEGNIPTRLVEKILPFAIESLLCEEAAG